MAKASNARPERSRFSSETLAVHTDFGDIAKPIETFKLGVLTVEACPGRDTLWIVVRREGQGAIALRTIPWPGPYRLKRKSKTKTGAVWQIEASTGTWTIELSIIDNKVLRLKLVLKPVVDLLLTFWPRDLFVLDRNNDPMTSTGQVQAAQRGLNTGQVFFCVEKPDFGHVMYVQNLSALNPFYLATETKPDGVVGGRWPELGYQPPTAPMADSPPEKPLVAGVEVIVSDALLTFGPECTLDEVASARAFIDRTAEIYPFLDKPPARYHDWLDRAKRTVRDLTAPEAVIKHYGHTYLHPYVASEYPDSMVQMSVLATLAEYETDWGRQGSLTADLAAGIGRFFDKELQTIRRYLPNVGKDKNKDAVDSWYLYHPLMNLARLGKAGHAQAERIFRESLDFAVKAAQHFNYVWPIQYDITDFSVIVQERKEDGLGQTDVGGLYAYVMLQAYELTGDDRYVAEAKAALRALEGRGFELAYQTNLTAWGAVACLKLWHMDRSSHYLDQSLVFVASFLHNCELWDSDIGHAKAYTNFFGITCLHDAPYMAAYECFEVFAACDEYLREGGDDLPESVRLLLSEFCKYALDFTWYFYPDALPQDAIAKDNIRNGHIDRKLSFPLEDLYGDGQPAGQVGQEIYGCGGAFIFASRAYDQCGDAPFMLFCDYPTRITFEVDAVRVELQGAAGQSGRLRVLKKPRIAMPTISVRTLEPDTPVTARDRGEDYRDYDVPANAAVVITARS